MVYVDPAFPGRLRRLRQKQRLSQAALARQIPCTPSHLSELETAKKRPSVQLVDRLDTVLDTGGELTRMLAPTLPPVAHHQHLQRQPVGRRLDAADVDEVRATIDHLVALDTAHGAAGLVDLGARQADVLSQRLAAGLYDPQAEADLHAVVADLGMVAAWLAYDADRQAESRRLADEALALARSAGARDVELLGLSHLSMLGVYARRGREALRTADRTLYMGLSPRLTGLFRLRRARALAVLGDKDALRDLDQARAIVAAAPTGSDPAWTWWVDAAELSWHSAMVHQDLGDQVRALDLFQATLHHYPPLKARERYNDLAHLLDAWTAAEAWADAEPVMVELVQLAEKIGSARTERLLAVSAQRVRRAGRGGDLGDVADILAARFATRRLNSE